MSESYVGACAKRLGISAPSLIDFYTPAFRGSESVGRSIDDAIGPMRRHIAKHGSEDAAVKALKAAMLASAAKTPA